MHSIWMLLLLMGICSMLARRYWASIFERDSLIALLKLPSHEKLDLVKRVHKSPPYATLLQIRDQRVQANNIGSVDCVDERPEGLQKLRNLINMDQMKCVDTIVKLADESDDNLALDYYVNQLLYLLLANSATAYKISGLKLQSRMLKYQLLSLLLTSLQFILPRLFIGSKYTLYGWYFSHAWWDYLVNQFFHSKSAAASSPAEASPEPNRVGYDISAQIWPTSTQCQYEQYGFQGVERVTVQCTVSINEICAKLFAIIWWFVTINLVVEFFSLFNLILSSLSYEITKITFSRRFWPKSRDESHTIANFRYQHNLLLSRLTNRSPTNHRDSSNSLNDEGSNSIHDSIDIRERKRLEAANDARNRQRAGENISRQNVFWYLFCKRSDSSDHDLLPFANNGKKLINESLPDENGFKEKCNDVNMLFLLYLLYLRLRCSRKKIQLVIRATTRALHIYLESLRDSVRESSPSITNQHHRQFHISEPFRPQLMDQNQEQQPQQQQGKPQQQIANSNVAVIQMDHSDVEASFVKQADSTTLHVSRA